jgi:hypothetical protein
VIYPWKDFSKPLPDLAYSAGIAQLLGKKCDGLNII